MRLSIVIPAYNEQDYLPACLEQVLAEVRRCADPDEVEVLVVDNASVDATAEVARRMPGVRLVHEPNKGLTKARQRGLEAALGEVIGYVDADTRMPAGWIDRVLRTFEQKPHVVCISGPYIYYDAAVWQRAMVRLYLDLPGTSGVLDDALHGGRWQLRRAAHRAGADRRFRHRDRVLRRGYKYRAAAVGGGEGEIHAAAADAYVVAAAAGRGDGRGGGEIRRELRF